MEQLDERHRGAVALALVLFVLGSLARFLGIREIADDVVGLMFETWPDEVADRIGDEVHSVLTTTRSGMLTISLVLAVYFASSGVESTYPVHVNS